MKKEFNDKLKDIASAAAGPTLEIVSENLIEGVAGTIVPGVGNIILSYKQNRLERRIEETIQMLIDRQDELNQKILSLTDEIDQQNIKGKYFEILMDYAINEPQEEKIKYLVNGYINIAGIPHPQEDVIRIFYDTLAQVNFLDIRVLRLYTPTCNDNFVNVMNDYQIDNYQYKMIQQKLARLGLLYSTNDQKRDENTDAIVKYLEELNKGKNSKLRVNHVPRSESYTLSSYGYRFFDFIESEYNAVPVNNISDDDLI